MSRKCPRCGKQSFTPFAMGSSVYMDVYRCNVCGAECMATQLEDITRFDCITASPEVLAEKLVYDWGHLCHNGDIKIYWKSTILPDAVFCSKSEAIAATVAKLKEVEK